jgi:CubicO group peptidase (beta-lactamase class C family)
VKGVSIARLIPNSSGVSIDNVIAVGAATKNGSPMSATTLLQCASMSKPIGTAFAIEFFRRRNITLTASVNAVLQEKCNRATAFRIKAVAHGGSQEWADAVEIRHLLCHSAALGQHFVYGLPSTNAPLPDVGVLISGFAVTDTAVYEPLVVHAQPGTEFAYSGGGFLLLQHLIESLERSISGKEQTSISEIMREWLKTVCDSADQQNGVNIVAPNTATPDVDDAPDSPLAEGILDNGECVTPRLVFPAMAAGMLATASGVAAYARALALAYNRSVTDSSAISHDTSLQMLSDEALDANATLAHGARAFMGAEIGLGAFVARGGKGSDRIALHSGANNGFRALFMICVGGPSFGHGVVVMCNGDNNAIVTNMSVARAVLLQQRRLHGAWRNTIDLGSLPSLDAFRVALSMSNVAECSQLVAQGYKKLLFDALSGRAGDSHSR